MKLKIVSPSRELLNQEIDHVLLPGELGQMDILSGHTSMTALLCDGVIRYFHAGSEKEIKIEKGLAEVKGNEVLVLTS